MSDVKLYGHREEGTESDFYIQHVMAMTGEKLHSKAEIAAELAYRDQRIAELEAQLASAEQPDLAEALRLLKLAACPANCYGGAIDCGGYQHPCQWCDEVEAMVAKIEESSP